MNRYEALEISRAIAVTGEQAHETIARAEAFMVWLDPEPEKSWILVPTPALDAALRSIPYELAADLRREARALGNDGLSILMDRLQIAVDA